MPEAPDSARPWKAEREVSTELAVRLIANQFPALRGAVVEPFAVGWDNTAFLVGESLVFRFPRRQMAVDLLEAESRVLPAIAPRLPLAVPRPTFIGRPTDTFPWPFAGYELLPGTTACRARLDATEREGCAELLARFLRALHDIGSGEARALGARGDTLNKLDVESRRERLGERLSRALGKRLLTSEQVHECRRIVAAAPCGYKTDHLCLCHGDLYARHLLVDDRRRISGVIDWGDVHLGSPAVDLFVVEAFLPPTARTRFWSAYGTVDEATLTVMRFRGVDHTLALLLYAEDTLDEALLREAHASIHHLTGLPAMGASPQGRIQ